VRVATVSACLTVAFTESGSPAAVGFSRSVHMPITMHIPGPLRQFTGGRAEVALTAPASTVREALDQLGSLYPGIRDRILTEQGALREHINIFVGNEDVRYTGGLRTPLFSPAVITIVPAISGGGITNGESNCELCGPP